MPNKCVLRNFKIGTRIAVDMAKKIRLQTTTTLTQSQLKN